VDVVDCFGQSYVCRSHASNFVFFLIVAEYPHSPHPFDAFHPSAHDRESEIEIEIGIEDSSRKSLLFWYDGQRWCHFGQAEFEMPSLSRM
jgi:hypothetical protein